MSDKSEQPSGGYEPNDPWAPPEQNPSRGTPASPSRAGSAQPQSPPPQPPAQPYGPPPPQPPADSVHTMPTVFGMPAAGPESGAVPPPPTAPGGPAPSAPGPYGYPGGPPAPAAYPDPYSKGPGPGYPAAPGYPGGGYPGAGYPGYGPGWQQGPANGMGVTAMVLGIVAVVIFCFWGLGIILGVLALIFGIVGRKRAGRGEATNGGMALAGIILGSIGALISAAFLAFLIWSIVENSDSYDPEFSGDSYSTSIVVGARR